MIESLLAISHTEQVYILDSGGDTYLDSHLLIAGVNPLKSINLNYPNPEKTLFEMQQLIAKFACIFTISYDFGLKLNRLFSRIRGDSILAEPDVFIACFDCLIIHDYRTGVTTLRGNPERFIEVTDLLYREVSNRGRQTHPPARAESNFTRSGYIKAVEKIKHHILSGDTYQTNLTQQFLVELPPDLSAQQIFQYLRTSHPGAFSAFLKRSEDYVVSISPERFFKVAGIGINRGTTFDSADLREIVVSPIKGTRPRGQTLLDDKRLKEELLLSEKDRAENVMIVDLLRNDLGRICRYGSVRVEKLCALEAHPTLYHLVSTVSGILNKDVGTADIIRAVFPCGSITGAPKIRTMQIIDDVENRRRGLSMGAIGYSISGSAIDLPNQMDLNVAIRTLVIRGQQALFNVGGGIVYDSDPASEYAESMLKARALFRALNLNPPE